MKSGVQIFSTTWEANENGENVAKNLIPALISETVIYLKRNLNKCKSMSELSGFAGNVYRCT